MISPLNFGSHSFLQLIFNLIVKEESKAFKSEYASDVHSLVVNEEAIRTIRTLFIYEGKNNQMLAAVKNVLKDKLMHIEEIVPCDINAIMSICFEAAPVRFTIGKPCKNK